VVIFYSRMRLAGGCLFWVAVGTSASMDADEVSVEVEVEKHVDEDLI